jgi:hypothetical protein
MNAYRFKNLVYLPIPKHAYTSYSYFFHNVLGWEFIESYNINWEEDTIFCHLLNPSTRYVNGLLQALHDRKLTHLLESPDFSKLLSTCVFFDQHSYPLTRMFDIEQCYKIEWLLLDHPTVTGETFTKAFLTQFDIDIDVQQIPKLNQIRNKSKDDRNQILHHTELMMNSIIHILQEDMNLYNKVTIHTHAHDLYTQPWQNISYKKNFVEHYGFDTLKKTRFNLQQ